MRFVKVLLIVLFAALAVVAGLFTAVIAAATAAALFFVRRMRRGKPAFAAPSAPPRAAMNSSHPDVIDVKATEIPVSPLSP